MRLAAYMEKHGLSDADVAKAIGIQRTEVWHIRTGRREPRARHVAKIEAFTRGAVRAKDLQTQ